MHLFNELYILSVKDMRYYKNGINFMQLLIFN